MTSHDPWPNDGHSDDDNAGLRSEHDRKPDCADAQPAGSPVPENADELYEPASRLTLEGDAYGALGNDHESSSSGSQDSTLAAERPAHDTSEDAYSRDDQPNRRSGSDRRGPGDVIPSDDRIREHVIQRLAHDRLVDIRNISVEVSDGRVTLIGTIPDHRMNAMIEDVVEDCPDVKAVTNRIQVVPGG